MASFVSPGNQEGKMRRDRNRFLALIRKEPGISRQACAQAMQVSTFKISRLAAGLIGDGVVKEGEASVESQGPGRPVCPLYLAGEHEAFAGVEFEADRWRLTIVDFAGKACFATERPFGAESSAAAYEARLEELLREGMAEAGAWWDRVSAVGLGCPGFRSADGRVIRDYEVLPNFRNVAVAGPLAAAAGKPVFATWNISCLATRDHWRRPASADRIALHVAVRSGISAVLDVRGTILRGRHGRAGELGIWRQDDDHALQEIAGLAGLRRALPGLPEAFWKGEAGALAAGWNDPDTRAVLKPAVGCLARALANLAVLTDPDDVFFYSPLFVHESPLWDYLVERFRCDEQRQEVEPVALHRSPASSFVAAEGAAFFALESVYPTELE